jgi:hypothetical protein
MAWSGGAEAEIPRPRSSRDHENGRSAVGRAVGPLYFSEQAGSVSKPNHVVLDARETMTGAILAVGSFVIAVIGTVKDYRVHSGIFRLNRPGVALILIAAIMMVSAIVREIGNASEATRREEREKQLLLNNKQLLSDNRQLLSGYHVLRKTLDKIGINLNDVSLIVASIKRQSDESGARELDRPLRNLAQSVESLQREVQGAQQEDPGARVGDFAGRWKCYLNGKLIREAEFGPIEQDGFGTYRETADEVAPSKAMDYWSNRAYRYDRAYKNNILSVVVTGGGSPRPVESGEVKWINGSVFEYRISDNIVYEYRRQR